MKFSKVVHIFYKQRLFKPLTVRIYGFSKESQANGSLPESFHDSLHDSLSDSLIDRIYL